MPNGLFTLTQQARAIGQGAWVNGKTPFVNYLVVAGGGSTGSYGGGGAGGLLQGAIGVMAGSAITVTVGAGGAAGGGNGSNSVFGVVTANGGGSSSTAGSGNGAFDGGRGVRGTSGQGNAGGDSMYAPTYYLGSGGGGAGTPGLRSNTTPGIGGQGIASDISGTRTAYAGGGGGGQAYAGDYNTPGGAGGGGAAGGPANSYVAQSGAANTGGGAGGTSFAPGSNAGNPAGGSGIVIISYPDTYLAPTATTGSPTVSTSGSGSIRFAYDQYFNYNAQSGFNFGTGDFTIEFFVKPNILDGNFAHGIIGFANASPIIYLNGDNTIRYGNGVAEIVGSALAVGTWYHIAVSRSSGVSRLFINGTQSGGNLSDSANLGVGSNRPLIGAYADSGGTIIAKLNAFLSNLRVIKGTALYTTNFTAPSAPLTAVANTQLLLSTVSGSYLADSSANSLAQTATVGPPVWNSDSPFATGLGFKNRVYTWTSSGSITF